VNELLQWAAQNTANWVYLCTNVTGKDSMTCELNNPTLPEKSAGQQVLEGSLIVGGYAGAAFCILYIAICGPAIVAMAEDEAAFAGSGNLLGGSGAVRAGSAILREGAAATAADATGDLTNAGVANVRALRGWAVSKGWSQKPGAGPETWGITDSSGNFSWRLKLKKEGSSTPGLQADSQVPRFDARLDTSGTYVNPFTGVRGNKLVGTHIPLNQQWIP
jgi:hypothetical protein